METDIILLRLYLFILKRLYITKRQHIRFDTETSPPNQPALINFFLNSVTIDRSKNE